MNSAYPALWHLNNIINTREGFSFFLFKLKLRLFLILFIILFITDKQYTSIKIKNISFLLQSYLRYSSSLHASLSPRYRQGTFSYLRLLLVSYALPQFPFIPIISHPYNFYFSSIPLFAFCLLSVWARASV